MTIPFVSSAKAKISNFPFVISITCVVILSYTTMNNPGEIWLPCGTPRFIGIICLPSIDALNELKSNLILLIRSCGKFFLSNISMILL